MLFKLSTVVAFVLAASPALSTIVVTSPVAATKGQGGKKLDIEWNDDGKSPKLSSDWGSINIFLATGSHDVQFKLQELATGLSNSATSGHYRIDKTVGPSGSDYFIRFESTKTGSDGNPAAMAFSSKFQITGMTGTFNQTVQDAINGKAGGDGQGTTGGPSSTASTSAIRTSIVSSTATNSATNTGLASNSGLAASNNGTSAAGRVQVGSALVGFGAVAAGVVALL